MHLIYHPEAEAEVIDAARSYKRQVPTLGAQFLDAVDVAASIILEAPARWRIVEADIRRSLMPRFPFGLYDRILPDHVRILTVKHHSRHPDYWRSRRSE
jgi:plasmid stabilization system protein ParE